jgi:hypothetical protein
LKFEFWFIQIKFDREMAKIKVIDLDEFYNFVVDDLFILKRLLFGVLIFWSLNFNYSNNVGWGNDQN